MVIKFRYKKGESKIFPDVYRPVADVNLWSSQREKWICVSMYIDSGADITLIPKSIGELLGFEFNKSEIAELNGVGGGMVAVIIKKVPIRIEDHEFEVKVAWSMIEDVPCLMGQEGIFDRFDIKFKKKDKIIEFEPLSES
ncbi:MAG: hypothetical protein CVT89_01360 [Candidatus Altiarchaeales archaeon HGW-Altiarchaeales-2]|nr:MAG: hypothetical protein CVT89_01360 [Candidatus Altiarchaeales archaeon HGW-Altiarchaeales-2]